MSKPAGSTRRWDSSEGPLSEEAVRRLFDPKRYRVSRYRYDFQPGLGGVTASGVWYVLRGQCEITFDRPVQLMAGDIFESGEGSYELEIISEEPFEVVKVWDLESLSTEKGLEWVPPDA
jgi:hypothetical protein